VGHKTASVVMSQAFRLPLSCGYPYSQIDRWNLTNGKNVVQTEKMRNGYSQKRMMLIICGWEFRKDIITHYRKKISFGSIP
jgi:endonuclease-3